MLILSFSPIASDARVLKQIEALKDRYELTTLGYGPEPAGVRRHVRLPDERVYWRYDKRALLLRRFAHAYWSNPAVAFVAGALADEKFDVVLANDIDSVGVALSLRPSLGVHADLHEYAPRQKDDNRRWRLFVAPFVRWMCRTFLPDAGSVTTVGTGIAREYERRFGVRAEVVTNSAPYAELDPAPVGEPIRLVHSGACLPGRGIDQIIEAVQRTTASVSLDLFLMPNDPGYLANLRKRVAGDSRIRLHDPVSYDRLIGTLHAHDVGVHVLPPVNFNNAWALPNKFFDYIQARLGVITGPSPEMRSVIEQRGVGAVAGGFDSAALAEVLDTLTSDRVAAWKRASDAAALDLSAGRQVEVWVRAIDALVAREV
ncbi:glycosyltransferase [Microbacterium sp. HJ5]